jgi:hemerythrin-like domain-containing protein
VLERLSKEHREHETLHARLDDVISGRSDDGVDMWTELSRIADLLTRAYRQHIEEEEKHLFPAARALLAPSVLEEMRAEMDARRGHARGVGISG